MASLVSCYAHQLNVMTQEVSSTYFGALYFLKMFSGSADFSKLSKKLNEFDKFALDTSSLTPTRLLNRKAICSGRKLKRKLIFSNQC